jgi:hypothetical protein
MWVIANRRGRFDRISRVLWTDAECALKTAHDSANRAAYNSTDWSGRIVSNVCAVGGSVGNPLRMSSQGELSIIITVAARQIRDFMIRTSLSERRLVNLTNASATAANRWR